jgi:hypothetical protein
MMIDWIWDAHTAAGGNLAGFIVGLAMCVISLTIIGRLVWLDWFGKAEMTDEEFMDIALTEMYEMDGEGNEFREALKQDDEYA